MYHGQYSITFESLDTGMKRNTWEDWRLIPSAPPMVENPEPYTNYVEVPGRKEGPLDLSEALSNGPVFLNTEGSWDFVWSEEYCPDMSRAQVYRTVTQFLHGRRFKITFEEDPDVSYLGRFSVGNPKPGNAYSTITINYTIYPTDENPIDINADNYTSNSGEIPWYSGPINQNSGSGSGGGSGGGGSGGGSSGTTYNDGWNAAIDAAISLNKDTKYYDGRMITKRDGNNWYVVVVGANYPDDGPTEVTAYTIPARKTGNGNYEKGWNEALDHFIGRYYYTGTYAGTWTPPINAPHVANPIQVYVYQLPKRKG